MLGIPHPYTIGSVGLDEISTEGDNLVLKGERNGLRVYVRSVNVHYTLVVPANINCPK